MVHECVGHEVDLLQQQLAAALDSARRRAPSAASVNSAQSAWLLYRKAQCEAEAQTIAPAVVPRCWLSLTEARIDEVHGMYRATGP
jgi:uncharacterized protein YecT (DUF1311 family)